MVNINEIFSKIKNRTTFILGPCVIEEREIVFQIAREVKRLSEKHNATFIFKASFDKANRTSVDSFRGPGLDKGLQILAEVKREFELPITTDIHLPEQAEAVAKVVDIIQIPAFLCRQTDLLIAAAHTGKIVNIKKAQFLSGEDMVYPLDKVKSCGNTNILLTERGSMFGYNNLVVDFRNIPVMQAYGYPVVMDCTHSVQRPGGMGGKTGGNREFVPLMAKAAQSFGANAFFMEVHPEPNKAKSDGPNTLELAKLDNLITDLLKNN